MPGPSVHIAVAKELFSKVLDYCPNDIQVPELERAFLAGAVAADLGYISVTHSFFSDLVHYRSSGSFIRNMGLLVESELEQAFVAGWATHWIVDSAIHPLVNASVGRQFERSGTPMTFADAPGCHIRVEMGLDINCRFRDTNVDDITNVWLMPGIVHLLHKSFERTYDASFDINELWRLAKRSAVLFRWLMRYQSNCRQPDAHGSWKQLSARALKLACNATWPVRNWKVFAFLHPIIPDSQLALEVDLVMPSLAQQFARLLESRFRLLSDLNLDTGESQEAFYSLSGACMSKLARLRERRS